MPLIRSIQILSDRIILGTPRGEKTFLFSDVGQAVINQGAAAIEGFINTRLNDPAREIAVSSEGRHFHIEVKVITLSPLVMTVITSNANLPITDAQRTEAVSQD